MASSGAPVVNPGVTTFTRTPHGPSSLASVSEAETMAALVAV